MIIILFFTICFFLTEKNYYIEFIMSLCFGN